MLTSYPCPQVDDLETLFVQPMLEFYQSSGVSATSKQWNALRQGILRKAIQKLVPQLQEETANRLLSDAKEVVVEAYGDQLWNYASLPPVQVTALPQQCLTYMLTSRLCWTMYKERFRLAHLTMEDPEIDCASL